MERDICKEECVVILEHFLTDSHTENGWFTAKDLFTLNTVGPYGSDVP